MTLPDVSVLVRDGALGISPAGLNGQIAVIGIASSGTGNAPQSIGDIQTLQTGFTGGPGVEAAAHILQVAGGPVEFMRITAAGAGSNGSVTKVGTGSSAMTISAGTPVDDFDVVVKLIAGAANPAAAAATFQYSLDGGLTWSPTIALPSTGIYVIPGTGLTVTFSAATLVAGDTYSFHATAPQFTNTELATALDALIAGNDTWFAVLVAGIPADAATYAAMFATLATKLAGAANNFARYTRAILPAPALSDSALITAQASLSDSRLWTPAGFANLASAIGGSDYLRPAGWVLGARLAAVEPHVDPGRTLDGPVSGVVAISRDEFKTQGLDAARFTTLQTRIGQPGFYFSKGTSAAAPTSDYAAIPNARVVDLATAVGRAELALYINDDLGTNANGTISETDARSIEDGVDSAIRQEVVQPGFAVDCSVAVNRTINLLSTGQVTCTVRIRPKGYARYITLDIGMQNPNLVQPSAA